MARLITFGCSNTHGEGLSMPEKQVWGSVLSTYLDREFVNQGIPGASNKEIVNNIINFKFQPDDMVFILWTMIDRYGVLNDKGNFTQFLPSSLDPKSIAYYKNIHTDYDHMFLFKIFVEYALDLLKKQNIQTYSLFTWYKTRFSIDTQSTLLDIDYGRFYKKFPKGEDNIHMGAKGNEEFAKAIYHNGFKKHVI